MRIPENDSLWLSRPEQGRYPDGTFAYRTGSKYGQMTYSVGHASSLDAITAKYRDHWSRWQDTNTIVTRVFEKVNGEWKYLAKYEFTRSKV